MQQKKTKINPRELAVKVLMDMDRWDRLSSAALTDALRQVQFSDKEDRAFATRLVEGTTEYRLQLDTVINEYAGKPVEKQKPMIRAVLRISVYQMLYMNSVPDHAVLSEAVSILRNHHLQGMTGVVNGILRNVQRGMESGRVQEVIGSSLAVRYSTPEWICSRLTEIYGQEITEKILQYSFTEHPITLRCSRGVDREELKERLEKAGVSVSEGLISERALRVSGIDHVRKLPGYREGEFLVQDESSMLAVESAGIREGLRVLDVCSAPGGKATYAAQLGGIVTARDISPEKTERIRENAERLRLSMKIEEQDAAEYVPEDAEKYDVVLADVPCSGLGVMGRKNDIKYHVTPEGVDELKTLAAEILENAAAYVASGGILLFSTCTILPEENRLQTGKFLEKHPEFSMEEERQLIQGVDPCDGFYFCRMRKRAQGAE